ncbi:hypothetical protein BC830DRAFT_1128846 [Chytriomyces sp. MP71]|nr:hypothetical protein BC830DRAFT_1128846 [Chytriomyces sp. MP71]
MHRNASSQRGHVKLLQSTQTTDDAEDAITTQRIVVVSAYSPAHFSQDGSIDPQSVPSNTVGIYSFRKLTRIDTPTLLEDALLDSLHDALRSASTSSSALLNTANVKRQSHFLTIDPSLTILALFTSSTDDVSHTINFDFAMYRRVPAIAADVDGCVSVLFSVNGRPRTEDILALN